MTFEALLSPVGVERFVAQYWGKRALHVPGTPSKLERIYSLARFQEMLDVGWPRAVVARAVFDGKGEGGADPALVLTSGAQAREAYLAGATVCIDRLETFVPELDALCQNAKAVLGYPGDIGVHAYWSPHRAGFRPHFDARIATTLQLHGRKRWRYGKTPAVEWPRDNAVIVGNEVRYNAASGERATWETPVVVTEWEEITLNPGDLLCLPAGVVHSASADESSFAINLHFNPVDTGQYLGRLLTHALGDRPEWRNVPPLFAHGAARDHVEGDGTRALGARLREAIDVLSHWLADPESLNVHLATELLIDARPARPVEPPVDLGAHSEVELAEGVYACGGEADERVTMVLRGHKVQATGSTAAVLRALLERRRVRRTELAIAGVGHETVRELLVQLEQAGIVRAVSP